MDRKSIKLSVWVLGAFASYAFTEIYYQIYVKTMGFSSILFPLDMHSVKIWGSFAGMNTYFSFFNLLIVSPFTHVLSGFLFFFGVTALSGMYVALKKRKMKEMHSFVNKDPNIQFPKRILICAVVFFISSIPFMASGLAQNHAINLIKFYEENTCYSESDIWDQCRSFRYENNDGKTKFIYGRLIFSSKTHKGIYTSTGPVLLDEINRSFHRIKRVKNFK